MPDTATQTKPANRRRHRPVDPIAYYRAPGRQSPPGRMMRRITLLKPFLQYPVGAYLLLTLQEVKEHNLGRNDDYILGEVLWSELPSDLKPQPATQLLPFA